MDVLLCLFLLFGLALGDISHLDRLLNRLDGSSPPPVVELTTPGPLHRVRHSHLFHELKEEYDEDEEEDDEESQADHVQRSPYSTSVGRNNWIDHFSARKNTGKIWTSYHPIPKSNNDPKSQNEVRLHLLQMSKESCRVPQPKIIRVADHYPSVSNTYFPPCTKLHVCAEDTGCCGPTQKCGPKASQKVELMFYITVDSPSLGGHYGHKTIKIDKLAFYNHTECGCQDRTDEMPRDTDLKTGLDTNRIPNQPAPYRCKCPSEYTVRNLANGSCTCDCFDKQRDCTKYKKGKENFNHHDRICIETGKCTIPSCDFGVFNRRLGRCPRKHEKLRIWPRYKA